MSPPITGVDLGPLLDVNEQAAARDQAARMVAALRDQQAQGIALKMTKHPMLEDVGSEVLKGAQAELRNEDQYGPEAQFLKRMGLTYGLAGKLGVAQIGADSREAEGEANRRNRLEIARVMADSRERSARAGGMDPLQKQWYTFAKQIDANFASGRNPLGLNQNILNRIQRVQALPKSQQFMNPQDVTELSIAMASILQGGGTGGQIAHRLIQEIRPDIASQDIAKFLQWISGNPQDAGARAFVKRFMASLDRETKVIQAQNKAAVRKQSIANADVIRSMSHVSVPFLRELGLTDDDISEIFSYGGGGENIGTAHVPPPTPRPRPNQPAPAPVPQPNPAPPASGGLDPLKIKEILERNKKEKSGA